MAEHVTANTARDRDDVFEHVAGLFDAAELVELTFMSAFFARFNRFTDSLRIPVESQDEVDKIRRSVDLDPAKVRRYFATMVERWPEEFPQPRGGSADRHDPVRTGRRRPT